jgi:glycerol-3-phosphate dehydrogenase (NAD(P)+)
MTVEGIRTTRAAHELAQQLGIEAPIIEQVYRVLYADLSLEAALQNLMERARKAEIEEAFLEGLSGLQERRW